MKLSMNNKKLKNIFIRGGKIVAVFLALGTTMGSQVWAQSTAQEQQAAYQDSQAPQPCVPGQTPGNISGFLTTETLGNIYLSTESWNENETTQTSVEFYATYDRQLNRWDGRGWNKYAGWVEFDPLTQIATFTNVAADPINYGNWNPIITGLGNMTYNENLGQFVGTTSNEDYTIENANDYGDNLVGAGKIGFENVVYQTELTVCDENVNLYLDGVNTLYHEECPIAAPEITWTSNAVINCQTDDGLWQNPGSRNTQNISGENASASITTSNSPQLFRLKCTGTGSGATVYGTAIVSCGPVIEDPCEIDPTSIACTDPGYCESNPSDPLCTPAVDPTSGIVIPDFKEV